MLYFNSTNGLIIYPGAPIGSDRYALTFLFESFFEEEGMGHVE